MGIVLRGVDMVYAGFDGPPQHGNRLIMVSGIMQEHTGPRQLHGAEPDTMDVEPGNAIAIVTHWWCNPLGLRIRSALRRGYGR